MAARLHPDDGVFLSTIGEQRETEISLEPTVNQKAWKPDRKVKMALAVQTFCVFIISIDMTILTATLPTVAQALDATAIESYWIAASYLLANAVCQPTMATLADTFGRQSIFFGSVLLFTIGSIVCATAPTVPAMLAGRSIQGVGGGGILSVNLIILSDLVPLLQRPTYQGYIQFVFSFGTFLAPILGGLLIKTDWRWVFYINLPFCGIGLVIIPIWLRYDEKGPLDDGTAIPASAQQLPSDATQGSGAPKELTTDDRPSLLDQEESASHGEATPKKVTIGDKISSIDWIGSAFMVASSTSFLIGLSWGGNKYQWRSPAVLVTTIVGLVGMVLTIVYERRFAKNPFLRLAIFEDWSGIAASICTVIQGYLLFAMTYYLVVYLMACKLYSPILAGTGLLPFAVTVVPVSAVTGKMITKSEHYRWTVWLGWSLSVLGLGLLIILDVSSPPAAFVIIFMCAGAAQGLLFIGHAVAIQASSGSRDAAHASSMYSFMRSFGLLLGVIVGYTVFQNFLRIRFERDGLPASIATDFEGFIPYLQRMSDDNPLKLELQQAYAWGLRMLFATSTGIGFLGLLFSLTIGDYPLVTPFIPEHRLRK